MGWVWRKAKRAQYDYRLGSKLCLNKIFDLRPAQKSERALTKALDAAPKERAIVEPPEEEHSPCGMYETAALR